MNFSEKDIEGFAKKYYQMDTSVIPLTGEYEFNYLLTATDGVKYIFKVASDENSYDFFDAQVKIVSHLLKTEVADKFFRYIPNIEGEAITVLQLGNRNYFLRLLTYLEGEFWVNIKERSDALHINFGNLLGRMDKVLETFLTQPCTAIICGISAMQRMPIKS